MIVLMETLLEYKGDGSEEELPGAWYREQDGEVWYEEELHIPTSHARALNGMVFDLDADGILDELKQLHKCGVRGDVHFADSCGPTYIRISLLDSGVFRSEGEVVWITQLEEATHGDT